VDVDDAVDRAPSLLDAPPVIENPTDAELVEAARAGDSFAITRLWQRHLSVAWTAARAASGRADAEPVVVRTAQRLIAELGDGRGPSGAARPHLLALVRQAVADEGGPIDGADGRNAGRASALELAPAETYRDLLPDGMGDGSAIAGAYTSLPTRWQETLWLADVDGLSGAEIAAELGLTSEAVESTLADARSALRAEWGSLRLAALPDDAPCRTAAAPQHGRRARAHLDECAGCRVVAAPPEAVSRRALATLPLLLLGAGGGIAFLESVRRGASAAATEPVPSVAETAAEAAALDALADDADAPPSPPSRPVGRMVALPVALAAAIGQAPGRRVAAAGAALAGIAATTALVATLALWNGGTGDGPTFLAESDGSADVAEPAPQLLTPEVVATDVPDEPESTPPNASPDDAPEAGTAPETETPAEGDVTDGPTASDGSAGAAPDDATPDGATPPSNGSDDGVGAAPGDGTQSIVAPRPPVAVERAPLDAELGRPGTNGWRTLTVTGEPNAPFTVSSGAEVLFTGALDSGGSAALQVRGMSSDVDSLALEYGTGGTSYTAAAAEVPPSGEASRRARTSSPTPAP
jgi:DNA-directed RNA polymerase specialized sigma24 family protein